MSRRLAPVLLLLVLLLPAAATAQVDLIGTWHVLVHYTDDNTSHPEQKRWIDRVWVFERKGSRMQWTEYPLTVFEDESGRFERRGTSQAARTLGAWDPNPGQLDNIRGGVRVNTRGMKRKSLRGSDDGGWRTVSRSRAGSASVITYQENWSVEGMPQLPAFIQEDVMGSGRSETLEGVTRYDTTEVEGSDFLIGTYERDGTRHGTFQLRRAGSVGMLEKKSQSEMQAAVFRRNAVGDPMVRGIVREDLQKALKEQGVTLSEEELDQIVTESITLYVAGKRGPELREALMKRLAQRGTGSGALRGQIESWLAENGIQLSDEELDAVVAESTALYAEGLRGEALQREVGKRLQQRVFTWVRADAVHDDSARYGMPFASAAPRELIIGPRGSFAVAPFSMGGGARSLTQTEELRNTYVFKMPVGSPVVAAREGRVVRAAATFLSVLHADGSFAGYWPLGELSVEVGQEVQRGDPLGATGNLDRPGVRSDVGSEPQLDFGVFVGTDDGGMKSLAIRFDDGTAEGLTPVTGLSYGGDRHASGD